MIDDNIVATSFQLGQHNMSQFFRAFVWAEHTSWTQLALYKATTIKPVIVSKDVNGPGAWANGSHT